MNSGKIVQITGPVVMRKIINKKSFWTRLMSLLLAFLFILSPLAPIFAAENSSPADSAAIANPTISSSDTAGVSILSDSASANGNADVPAGKQNKIDSTVNLVAPEKADSANAKNSKDKTKPKDDGLTMSASSLSSPSSSGSNDPRNMDKTRLPQSETLTGALVYEYPINIPPGRNNFTPDLKLTYNSQMGEEGSIVGYGWSLNIPYIEIINKKGTDKLYTENYYNSSLSGELISLGGTSYGSKVDNGEFLKYEFSNNSWLITDKQGTKYKFGYSSVTRQDNPADSAKVFKWMLEEIRDTNDNFIRYEYFKDQGQIYPYKIFYTGSGTVDGIFEVEFLRQTRIDAATSYKTGFSVKTDYRINEIQTKVNTSWVKKYALAYTFANNANRSVLSSVTESGQDELNNITTLPATSFNYQATNKGWTQDASWDIPLAFLASDGKDEGVMILDLNGDGLSDMMKSRYIDSYGNTDKQVYLNTGLGWTLDATWNIPIIFFDQYSKSLGVQIADVNGDGLPDLLKSIYNAPKEVYLNNGHGWTLNSSWVIPLLFIDCCTFDYGVRIADVNGDGLPDLLKSIYNSPKEVYLNNGSGWVLNTSWIIPTFFIYAYNFDEGVQIADINGDNLPDLLKASKAGSTGIYEEKVYLNDGKGWTLDATWDIPVEFRNERNEDQQIKIADINGDGLTDLLRAIVVGGVEEKQTYLNNGHGWVLDTLWNSPQLFINTYTYNEGVQIADVNGDSLPDLLKASRSGSTGSYEEKVYLNNGPKSDLLSRITYNTGGQTDVVYKPTPQYTSGGTLLNPALPFALDTVQQITTSDGAGLNSTATYSYEGGKYYYADAFERKFSGFAKVTQTDAIGNITKTYYHQADATNSSQGEFSDHISKIGKVYRSESFDNAGNLYSKTVNKWENYDLGLGRNFVKLTQKIDSSYDGNVTHKDKAETYTYDNTNGNPTEKVQWGEVTGTDEGTFTDTGTDKLTTAISYASNLTTNVIGLPFQETTLDQNSNKVKESKYYYDTLTLGNADKGNLTKEEKWKSGTDYINAQKLYNSYGLVTQETDPRAKITTYTYDSYNLYPATVTNALNQSTQYIYDYSLGKAKQATDPNGYVFQTVYDGLDRVIEEKQPDLTTPSILVTKSSYIYTDTANAVSIKKTDYLDATNSVDSYSYFDGLGRIIQTRKEAETINNFSVKDLVYNNRGLLNKESLAYYSTGTAKTTATADNTLYSTYAYDALGRITSTANAVGTITNAYDDWKVTTTDAKGTPKDLYKDAYDRLIQVDEHNSTTYTTTYNYDGAGNLTKITDASGNIRNFTYDGLGRRLTAEDLHAVSDATFGTWTYTYDASGNLTSTLDPKGQTVNYTYDDINRQLTEDYTGQVGTEVTYTYDAGTGGIGYLTSVAATGANVTYQYNPLGKTKQEVKTINSTNYQTDYTYDWQGNILTITNPDSSQVKYTYNTAGQLETVQRKESTDADFINVVTDFDYNPLESITYQAFQNGSSTTNTYDSTKLYRLSTKITTLTSGTKVQDLTYTYDANGNITRIADASQTNSSKTADYTYDSLNRLLSATATNVAQGQSTYTHTYTYDAIGNILTRTDAAGSYSYNGNQGSSYANPHAVTSVGSVSYTYDNNGNLLTVTNGLSNTWDYKNRLTQGIIGSTTTTYDYDYTGQRVKYSNGTTTTYYPTKNYNTDGTTPTKHIYAGDQLIATVKGTGATAAVYSVHTDHLTGSNVVTNSSGTQEELMDYYPYGNIRLDEKAGSFSEQRKYAGQEYDLDTQLSYMNSRYYKSDIGRFISQDPLAMKNPEKVLEDPQSLNYYAYARNNPLVNIDPDGKSAKTFLYGVGIGALWAASAVFIVAASPVVIPASVLTGAAVAGLGLVGYGTYANYEAYNNGGITKDQFDYNAGKLFGGTAAPAKFGEFGGAKESIGTKGNISTGQKPYSNSRPSYGKGQVDTVWENAKDSSGNVFDPNTSEQLFWDNSLPRNGQWDMGHKPFKSYEELHNDYMGGGISKEEFLREYRNPDNYHPQSISSNRSREFDK